MVLVVEIGVNSHLLSFRKLVGGLVAAGILVLSEHLLLIGLCRCYQMLIHRRLRPRRSVHTVLPHRVCVLTLCTL
jgi:hypothetical protein